MVEGITSVTRLIRLASFAGSTRVARVIGVTRALWRVLWDQGNRICRHDFKLTKRIILIYITYISLTLLKIL